MYLMTTTSYVTTHLSYMPICDLCNGNHYARSCPIEKDKNYTQGLKEFGGHEIENKIGQYIKCPAIESNGKVCGGTLTILNDNSPSKDAVCTCGRIFEIKSKALSIPKGRIPDNLAFYGGLYDETVHRIEKEGLHILFVIYSINRIDKTITISTVYHASNRILRNEKYQSVIITKRKDNNLSYIEIPNKINLKELSIPEIKFSFKTQFEILKAMVNK